MINKKIEEIDLKIQKGNEISKEELDYIWEYKLKGEKLK